jgi:hypothetical protein
MDFHDNLKLRQLLVEPQHNLGLHAVLWLNALSSRCGKGPPCQNSTTFAPVVMGGFRMA